MLSSKAHLANIAHKVFLTRVRSLMNGEAAPRTAAVLTHFADELCWETPLHRSVCSFMNSQFTSLPEGLRTKSTGIRLLPTVCCLVLVNKLLDMVGVGAVGALVSLLGPAFVLQLPVVFGGDFRTEELATSLTARPKLKKCGCNL